MKFSRPGTNNFIGWLVLFGVWSMTFVYRSSPLEGFIFCAWRRTFGLLCPGCGLTRSFCSMSAGAPLTAFNDHFTGPLLYCALIWTLVSGVARCFAENPDRWQCPDRAKKIFWYSMGATFIFQVIETVASWFAP